MLCRSSALRFIWVFIRRVADDGKAAQAVVDAVSAQMKLPSVPSRIALCVEPGVSSRSVLLVDVDTISQSGVTRPRFFAGAVISGASPDAVLYAAGPLGSKDLAQGHRILRT